MYKYEIVRRETIPGSLENFRALMHEFSIFQSEREEDSIFLQGERTPSEYPQDMGRWEVTLGGTLQQRGFILARELLTGETNLQFAYYTKFKPIGSQFDVEFANRIMKHYTMEDVKADILIVTVTEIESEAVLDVFEEAAGQKSQPAFINDRVYHKLGEVGGAQVFMVQSEMGSGSLGASQQTVQKGIEALTPIAVIMVGIAFGIDDKKHAIGDILVSQQIMLYELQRVGIGEKQKLIPRGDRATASPSLLNIFRSAALYWDKSIANIRFGLILSGEKLVDNVEFRQQLLDFEPEAIGGEMEGAGLYVACQDAKVDCILVKAICDWADGNKAQDKKKRQKIAAYNAVRFVLHTIQTIPIKKQGKQQESDISSAIKPQPRLALKIIDHMGHHTDKILFEQRANRQDFRFGLAILNIREGSIIAEKINARIECSWDGNKITSAPAFNADRYERTTQNWQVSRSHIRQGVDPYPAILAFHGTNDDRCAYGHPIERQRFTVTVAEKMNGRFILNYTISSANPPGNFKGQLEIIIK